MEITQELLNERFYYDNKTGDLINKISPTARIKKGTIAGFLDKFDGYKVVVINGKKYRTHRIIWFMFHGCWPEYIDHINGIRHDNRIDNLRNVTFRGNAQNRPCHRDGRLPGTTYSQKCTINHWVAQATVNKKTFNLGCYKTEQKAHDIYMEFCDFIEQEKRESTHTEVILAG